MDSQSREIWKKSLYEKGIVLNDKSFEKFVDYISYKFNNDWYTSVGTELEFVAKYLKFLEGK